jgi:hypothetical protein
MPGATSGENVPLSFPFRSRVPWRARWNRGATLPNDLNTKSLAEQIIELRELRKLVRKAETKGEMEEGHPVCVPKNLNTGVVVMKSAQDGA